MNKIFKIGAAVAAIAAISAVAYKFLKKDTEDECTCECNHNDCCESHCDGECDGSCACHEVSATDAGHDSDTNMQDANDEVVCEETQKEDATETASTVEQQDSEENEPHSAEKE